MVGVSIRLPETREYMKVLTLLALEKDTSVGALVLDAINQRYGSEIKERRLFFEKSVTQNSHALPANIRRKRAKAS